MQFSANKISGKEETVKVKKDANPFLITSFLVIIKFGFKNDF